MTDPTRLMEFTVKRQWRQAITKFWFIRYCWENHKL